MASWVSWILWACSSSPFFHLLSPSSFPFPSFSVCERMLTASASWGLQTAITATLTQDGGGQVQPGRNGCSACYQIFAPDKMPCHCCEWSLLLLTSVSLNMALVATISLTWGTVHLVQKSSTQRQIEITKFCLLSMAESPSESKILWGGHWQNIGCWPLTSQSIWPG